MRLSAYAKFCKKILPNKFQYTVSLATDVLQLRSQINDEAQHHWASQSEEQPTNRCETIPGQLITVEPDMIATKILAFPSKSSRNKNDSDLIIAIP